MFEYSNLKQVDSIEEKICKWAFKWYSKQFQYQIIKLNCSLVILILFSCTFNETYSAHKHQWTTNDFRFKYNTGAFEKESATLIQNKSFFPSVLMVKWVECAKTGQSSAEPLYILATYSVLRDAWLSVTVLS